MTNAEAIKIINQYDCNFYWTDGERIPTEDLTDAFELAVKALDAPTVLQETDLDETEQRILRKFRELREKGRENKYIHNPTAWALYWTWRDLETWSNMIDRKEGQQ